MLAAEDISVRAADEHLLAFNHQMRDIFGVVPHIASEPYLAYECKRYQLQLVQRLDRLAAQAEKVLAGKSAGFYEAPAL